MRTIFKKSSDVEKFGTYRNSLARLHAAREFLRNFIPTKSVNSGIAFLLWKSNLKMSVSNLFLHLANLHLPVYYAHQRQQTRNFGREQNIFIFLVLKAVYLCRVYIPESARLFDYLISRYTKPDFHQ